MARIPDSELERLKAEVAVERLVEASGIRLKGAGKDILGCVVHAMSVHGFTACRSRDFMPCRPGFHGMSVHHFTACRSSS